MQNFSEKIQIVYNEELGRHYVAAMDIDIGEVILSEKPLLIAPDWECEQMRCTNCFEESYIMCEKCNFFPMCMDCREHDAYDCAFIENYFKCDKQQLLVRNYGIFAVLKLLLLMENPKTYKDCEYLLKIKQKPFNDIEMLNQSEMWQEHEKLVVQPLMEADLLNCFTNLQQKGFKFTSKFLHLLCLLIDAHSFELNTKSGHSLKGVYVFGTRLPHDCVPNVVVSMDDQYQEKLYASVPIKAGSVLYNCYVNPLMGTSQRRHHLRLTRLHDCACRRCLDPTELGTHLSTLRCLNCEEGKAICDILETGDWICDACGHVHPLIDVYALVAQVGMAMMEADGDLEQYEHLLVKYGKKLHPNHFLLIDIKQNIGSILRSYMTSALEEPNKQILQRRVKISEEVLPVVRAVTPGISKLYAITLFEYLLALLELSELQYKDNEITEETFEVKLKLCKEIARKSIQMLAYEPTNSPEGHVLSRFENEEQRIENLLKNLSHATK